MHKEHNGILFFSAYVSLIALTAFAANYLNWSFSAKVFWEIVLNLCVLVLPFLFSPLREFVVRLPRPHLLGLLLMVFCMYVGQFIPASRTTFPFVPWQMFTNVVKGDIVYYEYWGNDKDGGRVQIFPSLIFPSLEDGRINGGLRARLKNILVLQTKTQPGVQESVSPSPDLHKIPLGKRIVKKIGAATRAGLVDEYEIAADIDGKERQFNNMLIALGKMHNRRHEETPIHSLEVFRCARTLAERGENSARCQSVWQADWQ